jgi:acyl carrier protein
MSDIGAALTDQQILDHIKNIFVENFEIDSTSVTLDARLYDDLDIDSIDAVDLVVALKEMTGRKIEPDVFKQVRTVGDVVDAVRELIAA